MSQEKIINPNTGRYIKTAGRTFKRMFPTGKMMLDSQSDNPEIRANANWYLEAAADPEKFGFKSLRGVRMSRTYDLNHTTPNKKGMTTLIDNPERYANNPHLFDFPSVDDGPKERKVKRSISLDDVNPPSKTKRELLRERFADWMAAEAEAKNRRDQKHELLRKRFSVKRPIPVLAKETTPPGYATVAPVSTIISDIETTPPGFKKANIKITPSSRFVRQPISWPGKNRGKPPPVFKRPTTKK